MFLHLAGCDDERVEVWAMMDGSFISYSEITGQLPKEADIAELLRPLDARKVLFLLSRINMHLRLASASEGTTYKQAVGNAQAFLFQNFTDEGLFEDAKRVLGTTKMHERVLFHPLQLLNMMRCAVVFCRGTDEADGVTDEQRYTVGRCCLMMNDLLVPADEQQKLLEGCENIRKARLITQLLPGFEVANSGHLNHLVQRSTAMFNLLLSDATVKTEIFARSGGYDFIQRFRNLTGVALEHWIALTFCCIAFYNQYGGGDGSQQEYKYLWIDPRVVLGTSKISQGDFDTILKIISKPIDEFAAGYALPSKAGPGVDVTAFKFHPLIQIGLLYICSDYAFLVEKMFAGAYWALHDREDEAGRDQLSRAWGYIFERYVNWWAQGRSFKKAMTYYPFPLWADKRSQKPKKRKVTPVEAFDAVILEGSRMVALECKGGFLTLDAKHSLNMRLLLRDLNKKFAKACRQLAKAIGELFGIVAGRTLQDIPTEHVTRVVPVIVVQDSALRSLGVNWWLNRQFQRMMRSFVLRPGVTIEPVTILHIDEFETMIDSAEGPEFDFVGTLQLRNFRDAEGMSDLLDFLLHASGYGAQHSSRRKELEDEFRRCVLEYAFDLEHVADSTEI
jgi:hypothetical protein